MMHIHPSGSLVISASERIAFGVLFVYGISFVGCGPPKHLGRDSKTAETVMYAEESALNEEATSDAYPGAMPSDDDMSITVKPMLGSGLLSNPLDSISKPVLNDKVIHGSHQESRGSI